MFSNVRSTQSQHAFMSLPTELIDAVLQYMSSPKDMRNFALTCRKANELSKKILMQMVLEQCPEKLLIPLAIKYHLPPQPSRKDYLRILDNDEERASLIDAQSLFRMANTLEQKIIEEEHNRSYCFATGMRAVLRSYLSIFLIVSGILALLMGSFSLVKDGYSAFALYLLLISGASFLAALTFSYGSAQGWCAKKKLSDSRNNLEAKLRFGIFSSTQINVNRDLPPHEIRQDDDLEIGKTTSILQR